MSDIRKIIVKILFLTLTILSFSNDKDIEDKIEKYNQYKKLVTENREKERKRNLPSPEEIQLYYTEEKLKLEREKLEYKKKLEYERALAEKRRDNLIDSIIMSGVVGYGGYRLGRYHNWW